MTTPHSTIAYIQFNQVRQQWEAHCKGELIGKTTNIEHGCGYLEKTIGKLHNAKARRMGVTGVKVLENGTVLPPAASGVVPGSTIETVDNDPHYAFSIGERFDMIGRYVSMVGSRAMASAIITGTGGLGKSHTVFETLQNEGYTDLDDMGIGEVVNEANSAKTYTVVRGFSTPKSMYRTLYENRGRTIIFDDCDSVLANETAVNVLKAALDSYDRRIVSWKSEKEDDLPKSFEFTGGVIFISNFSKTKIPQPLRSRALNVDVTMTRAEVLQRMRTICEAPSFMPDTDAEVKLSVMDYLEEVGMSSQIRELNLRSYISAVKTAVTFPDDWNRAVLYQLINA